MVIDEQIKIAYEQENMSPEEIASDQGLSPIAVKAKLMQISSKYRKDARNESEDSDTLNFSNEQLEAVNQVIFETALSAEHSDGSIDYKTRLTAAMYVRDDKKGRKEVIRGVSSNTFNILQLNEKLAMANNLTEKMLKAS
jgi:hypothetical protein